jgi:hypothetical protein
MSGGAQGVCRKKPDPVAMTAGPQFARKQHQMIVVHPNDVILVHQRAEAIGEQTVDSHVAAGVGARIFLQVDPVMEDRPEHAVGEPIVIFLDVVGRQVDQDVRHLVDIDRRRLGRRLFGHFAAPAEPYSVATLECGLHRHRHPAGERGAGRVGHRDPIGNDYEPRAHASSQLDDSLVAVLMMPAME